jgi:hypothetical protein
MNGSRRFRWVCALLTTLLLLAAATWVRAAGPVAPPAPTPSRLAARFDFEERQLGNFEDLPRHWNPIGRPAKNLDPAFLGQPLHRMLAGLAGFPDYNVVAFDKSQKVSGEYSFHLGVNGGNAGAFLEAGAVPVTPGSDYRITTRVLTPVLRYARARLMVYFIDGGGRRIDASIVSSPLVATDGRWQTLNVVLRGDDPAAASIGMQLELLQPQARPDTLLGGHQVVYQDVHADAWFDDIEVWQAPRMTLTTPGAVHILRASEKPQLTMTVHDLAGGALTAEVVVSDLEGRAVARDRRTLPDPRAASWSWTPSLDRCGWYRADLVLTEGTAHATAIGAEVARQTATFLIVPDEPGVGADGADRFTLDAQDLPEAQVDAAVEILQRLGGGGLLVSCWERTTTAAGLRERQHRLGLLLGRLAAAGCPVTLSLSPLPDELARQADADPHDPLTALAGDPEIWKPFLTPILLQQGQQVSRWQLGTCAQPTAFARPDLPAVLARTGGVIGELVHEPRLMVPWRLDQPRRPEVKTDVIYALDLPPEVRPDYLGQYLAPWSGREGSAPMAPAPVALVLREPGAGPGEVWSQPQRVADLALRVLYGLEAGAESFTLAQPWAGQTDQDSAFQPDATLGVFAALGHRLGGRKLLGRMDLGPGLECMIFGDPAGNQGTLAVWATAAAPRGAAVDMYFGPAPRSVDLFGNRADLVTVDGRQHLAVGTQPIFIEGVDTKLALFRAGVTVAPSFLDSTQAPQTVTLTIANPWPRTISGTLVVLQPQSWHLEPRRVAFNLAAGQTCRVPVEVGLPASELVGRKTLTARVDLTAERNHSLDVALPLEVGRKDIVLDAAVALEPDAKTGRVDAVVTQTITNRGPEILSLYCFASLPGFPRQERIMPRLDPGQSVVRRFRFQGAAEALGAADIRVGVRDTSGPMQLNKLLSLRAATP